jgi:tripartite-type tricarboxylate transporter receptor subunit TctC
MPHLGQSAMNLTRRKLLNFTVGAAALPMAPHRAWSQAYPARPIRMIVFVPAGGPSDTIARIIAEHMSMFLHQPVVIENVTGASGSIALGRVVQSGPDGYTLSYGSWSTHVVMGASLALKYDLVSDFKPIAMLVDSPMLMVAKREMQGNDLRELITWLGKNPNRATLAIAGQASAGQLAGALFEKETGTHIQFVSYRGLGPALVDLMAGHTDLMFDLGGNSLPSLRAGTIKAYAALSKHRLSAAPDIPTVDEAGVPGLYVSSWQSLWAPRLTPDEIIAKLNAAVVDALAAPAVRQRLIELGLEIPPRERQTPEALGALQKREIEKWWPIIRGAGIRPE